MSPQNKERKMGKVSQDLIDKYGVDFEHHPEYIMSQAGSTIACETFDPVERSKYLGASEVATAIGESPFEKTPEDLRIQKVKQLAGEHKQIFERGHEMEPTIIRMFEEQYGVLVTGRQEEFSGKDNEDFLKCHIDGRFKMQDGEKFLIEVKAPGSWSTKSMRDECPYHYIIQCQIQMHLSGIHRCAFVALDYDKWELIVHWIDYEATLAYNLVEDAESFWKCVTTDTVIPLQEELPLIEKKETREPSRALLEYVGTEAALKESKKAFAIAKKDLERELGEHRAIDYGIAEISWKDSKGRKTIKGKELLAYAGEVLDGFNPDDWYKHGKPSRNLKVKLGD